MVKLSFDQNFKSVTIGSANQPVFFNLTLDTKAYYICTVRYRLIRSGAAAIHELISDGYREFIQL